MGKADGRSCETVVFARNRHKLAVLKNETKSDLLANTLDNRRNCRHIHMLDAKAFVDSIAIAPRRWHTAGDAWSCSSGSDAAHCYFGSTVSFSRFCALAHAANAP